MQERDAKKDAAVSSLGFRMLRFGGKVILSREFNVLEAVCG
jgi:very-short-patch-repair endonuclease